ncbi:hypothetical protein SO802_017833 [Lithocarpus litseifolius]|uniref:RNase H type-1 domain-containing protein n=1 Tax=Lithocarpus litseifolius TaxID=425828 RepID=A0AAW2CMH7_9ROSI
MGFRDLRAFNLAMLAKQGWRLLQEDESLLFKCFKARYFPRSNFLEAVIPPNCSFVWRSIMAAQSILKNGCCWRTGNGYSISVFEDRWIPNHPTNKILYPASEEFDGRLVADLLDPDLHCWRRELITSVFHTDDVEAICRIPLSHRYVPDILVWMHNKNGLFSVKSAYRLAVQILKGEEWTESSSGCAGKNVWNAPWKLNIPNKIKVFGWRACQEILPTRSNLAKRRIIHDNVCLNCTRFPESTIHALWDCGVAMDVWAGSSLKLQKCVHGQADMLELMEYLLSKLSVQEMELFLVQAWLIWNQRNNLLHGGMIQDPNTLCRRAVVYLEEYRNSQGHLRIDGVGRSVGDVWKPPPNSVFKLNFDAAVFGEAKRTGFGAVIRNDMGAVMAAMSAGGPPVSSSDEAELLACRKAVEFSTDAGFSELVIEGDNSNVLKALSSSLADWSLLGNVVDDVRQLAYGLRWVKFSCIRRGGNRVAHALAQHARNISEDMFWLEDSPPPALNALYQDSLLL